MRESDTCSFPKERRLRRKQDFDAVFATARRISGDGLTLRYVNNGLGCSRLGCMIGKKSGNAVERNRLRRIFKEIFRTFPMQKNRDLLVTLYASQRDRTNPEIMESFRKLVARTELLP